MQNTGPETYVLKSMAEIEAEAIRHTLLHLRGSATNAARVLGIGRSTLYRKIAEYGLKPLTTDVRKACRRDKTSRPARRGRDQPIAAPADMPTMKDRFPPGTFGSPECNAALLNIMRKEGMLTKKS